jgi:hypothetical protein
MSESNEIVILLPGQIEGNPLILAETSANHVSINSNLVPSLIVKVWWNESVIVTENHPMKPRNKFPGDSYALPDRTETCWYIVDLQNEQVLRFDEYEPFARRTRSLSIDPGQIRLMKLRDAQRLREKELGFEFTAASVNRFLRSGGMSSK